MTLSQRFSGLVISLASAFIVSGCLAGSEPDVQQRQIAPDGITGITDTQYNALFSGNDAAKGIAALIAQGKVTVNGSTVPQASGDRLDINGGRGLWKNADGTWSWDVHVLFKGANKTYDEAVLGFVNHVTMLRGTTYTLTLTDGVASALSATVTDVAMADTVSRGTNYTTLTTVARGDNSTDKPSPATVQFSNSLVEGDPQSQDIVLYWKDGQGWHLKRATPLPTVAHVTTTVTAGVETYTRLLDGVALVDSRLTLQYSEPWSRPSQPFQSMVWMEENDVSMTQWQSVPGVTIGLSRGSSARTALATALSRSRSAWAAAQVSAAGDGSDITVGTPWVTQAYHDIFGQAIADAQTALDDTTRSNAQIEGALWRLSQAYGGRTGDRNSWLENTYFGKGSDYGRAAAFDTGYNGTGFQTFALSHLGTATAAASSTSAR